MDGKDLYSGVSDAIDEVVCAYLKKLPGNADELSVADATRLFDLRQKITSKEIREVEVRWVESNRDPFAIKQ